MLPKKIILLFFITSFFLASRTELLAATFTVSSLSGGTNNGSLYAAMTGVNASIDLSNTIIFTTNGTITLSTILPAVSNQVTIDGFSASGWSNKPVVSINFNGTPGLFFTTGSDNSSIKGLSLVNASDSGITLESSFNTLYGNLIGVLSDGVTIVPNHGNGLTINSPSSENLVAYTQNFGSTNIDYYNATNIPFQPVSGWEGIRGSTTTNIYLSTTNTYLMCGIYDNTNGLLFIGNIEGTSGSSFIVNNPSFNKGTTIYGPDLPSSALLRLVGTCTTLTNSNVYGFVFDGTTNDFNNPTNYATVYYPNSSYNYVHSTMGGLAVVNVDVTNIVTSSAAYIYNIASSNFVTNILYPGSLTDSAYGIWWNGGTSYTICGGYSTNLIAHITNQKQPIGTAFLVDYDSSQSGSNAFTHWTSFVYPANTNYVSHFQGISGINPGYYTLSADVAVSTTNTSIAVGSFVTVARKANGSFGEATWIDLNYPLSNSITSNDSVYGNNIVGFVSTNSPDLLCIQATINGLDVVNTITGNKGSGIMLNSSSINFIGSCILDSNTAYGISAFGDCSGTSLMGNSVSNNGLGAYNLMHAKGITVGE